MRQVGQNYRLAHWRTASQELDYRRFFDIDTLIGLRVEDEVVFADTHALVLSWVAAGVVDGLRIDHIDGLWIPWPTCGGWSRLPGGTWGGGGKGPRAGRAPARGLARGRHHWL